MKIFISFIALVALFATVHSVFVPPRHGQNKDHLLGSKQCTWGPSFWCQNLTNAATCKATKHCIQTVWIYKQVPVDASPICQTCLDMVKQARDQLESNETQELIKEVFEGSCALLHLKPVVKECDKIADNYIPDLIDTLASEMNPQVVCSVAGLCNSEFVNKLLEEEKKALEGKTEKPVKDTCGNCHKVVQVLQDKFQSKTRDQVLTSFLLMCRKTGSLSDACSNIVITYFTEIYNHISDNFNPTQFCLLSGECSTNFHTHAAANVEITPISHIGYVPIGQKDDLPCDMCEQLVDHLRDILVTNTTELEFKKVLEGLCQQTKSFQTECLSLVDTYYSAAYSFLVSELNSTAVCEEVGICPTANTLEIEPIAPLLPVQTAVKAVEIMSTPKKPLVHVDLAKDETFVKILSKPEEAQLPIERMMVQFPHHVQNKELCAFCEYFLHYVQEEITTPKTENEIREIIDKACEKLPSSINATCTTFVSAYEPILVALLAQQIDPSRVCPAIRVCPSESVKDVEVFMQHDVRDNDKCPLCLFAVTQLREMIKDKKTEDNIKNALKNLCSKLPSSLVGECDDFVNTYSDQLIEMLLADLTAQEVCVYLKLCTDSAPAPHTIKRVSIVNPLLGGDVETNMIPDNTVNGLVVPATQKAAQEGPQCVLCEFIMKEIEETLQDNKTEAEIIQAVRNVCNVMPSTIKKECNDFVDQYGDTVIQLLIQTLEPDQICSMMDLCARVLTNIQVQIFDCAVCEASVYAMEKILANPKVDHNMKHVLEKTCRALPSNEQDKCQQIIEKYGTQMFNLVEHFATKQLICHELGLCSSVVARPTQEVHVKSDLCVNGPAYWCTSKEIARNCGNYAYSYCKNYVWDQLVTI